MNDNNKQILRWSLLTAYCILLIVPGYVFFDARGGSQLLASLGVSFATTTSLLFPLVGLYAFSLLSLQLIIGSNMRRLRPIFPNIMNFHRYQGLIVFGLVLLHPSMVLATYGLKSYIARDFVAPDQAVWIIPAWLALAIIPVTVTTAVIAWKAGRLTKIWRWIHLANYLAFALVFLHSLNLGSDLQTGLLRYIWLFYGLAALVSLILRVKRSIKPKPAG